MILYICMCELQLENNRCIEKVIGRKYGNQETKQLVEKWAKSIPRPIWKTNFEYVVYSYCKFYQSSIPVYIILISKSSLKAKLHSHLLSHEKLWSQIQSLKYILPPQTHTHKQTQNALYFSEYMGPKSMESCEIATFSFPSCQQ